MEENKDAVKFENLMKTINKLLDISIWDNATYDLERWYRI